MNPKLLLISSLLLWSVGAVRPQKIVDYGAWPFGAGEKLSYEVHYQWHFIWVDAGRVVFSVDSTLYGKSPAYHFKSNGKTLDKWNWLFRINNQYESLADAKNLKSFWFFRNVEEGNYFLWEKIIFDNTNNHALCRWQLKNKPENKTVVPFQNQTTDILTAVYRFRMADFNRMQQGDQLVLSVLLESQIHSIKGVYQGIEMITDRNGRHYRCHKIKVILHQDNLFKSGDEMTLWLSDDLNKIPVLVEAKILVGSIKAWLNEASNLKYPL